MIYRLVFAPIVEPVSVDEIKVDRRITYSTDDAMIQSLIVAAREEVEDISRRRLISQTRDGLAVQWPAEDYMEIGWPPLQSVTSITYIDEDGTEQTFDSANYIVDTASQPGRVWLAANSSWPSATLRPGPSITVRFVCGYGADPHAVPATYRNSIRALVATYYENRETIVVGSGLAAVQLDYVRRNLLRDRAVWS